MRLFRRAVPSRFLRAGVVAVLLSGLSLAQETPNKPSDTTSGQNQETVYKAGKDGVTAPRAIYSPPPEFSEEARRANYEGQVILKATVSSGGTVTDAHVVNGAGMGLDEKAIEAVRRWKFKPATKDGKPVAAEVTVEVYFSLPKSRH